MVHNFKMKSFMSSTIIYTLFCFTIVKPQDIDETTKKIQLNEFLGKLQQQNNIVTRTVQIDDDVTSINHFFESSNALKLDNRWKIINEDVNRTAYLLYSVLSCEYSEYTYYLIKLIEGAIKAIYIKKIQIDIQDSLFRPIQKLLSPMILTLVNLLNYTKYLRVKQLEIINILLSWNIYIENYVMTNTEKDDLEILMALQKQISLTNYQVERYLKQFMLNNCSHNVQKFEEFKQDVNKKLRVLVEITITDKLYFKNTKKFIEQCLQTKTEELNNMVYDQFLSKNNEMTLFVLAPSKINSMNLRSLISEQVPTGKIRISWDGITYEDLNIVYNEYISKNVSGIKPLLQFERLVLQTITKIIIRHSSNFLRTLVNDPVLSTLQILTKCQNPLISTLDKYIQQFKKDGQSTYLITNMSIITAELRTLCFYNTRTIDESETKKIEIEKYIDEQEKLKIEIPKDTDFRIFIQFLDALSKMIIFNVLHPSVSNVFWEILYFVPTNISDHIIDLKYLHLEYEKLPENDDLCWQISTTSNKIESIDDEIINCETAIKSDIASQIENCFKNLHSTYTELKLKINDIILREEGVYRYNWKKLLLSLVYIIDDVKSCLNKDNNCRNIQDLNILQDHIKDYYDVAFHVSCQSMSAVYTEPIINQSQNQSHVYYEVNNIYISIENYKYFFETLNNFMEDIVTNAINTNLTLYWDGIGRTLDNVHEIYSKFSLNILRENYDYFTFFIRWLLAVVYSKIMDIVIEMETWKPNDKCPEIMLHNLWMELDKFKNLPLYIALPVNQILNMFLFILGSYNVTKKDSLINYKNVLQDELEKLGFIPSLLRREKNMANRLITFRIQTLIDTISRLIVIYEKYKIEIKNNANDIGIDQNDLVMMFRKWYSYKDDNQD